MFSVTPGYNFPDITVLRPVLWRFYIIVSLDFVLVWELQPSQSNKSASNWVNIRNSNNNRFFFAIHQLHGWSSTTAIFQHYSRNSWFLLCPDLLFAVWNEHCKCDKCAHTAVPVEKPSEETSPHHNPKHPVPYFSPEPHSGETSSLLPAWIAVQEFFRRFPLIFKNVKEQRS